MEEIKKIVIKVLEKEPVRQRGDLSHIAKKYIERKDKILRLAGKHPPPFYVLDQTELHESITSFKQAFSHAIPGSEYFYAIKMNHEPRIVKAVLTHGFGLDVSSERELRIALQKGAKKILFSGPGKTDEALALAVRHSDAVVVLMDSFSELARLRDVLVRNGGSVRAGVRVCTKKNNWNKFGIPLKELGRFWREAKEVPGLRLEGIQHHVSWNANALPYRQAIREIASYLGNAFTAEEREGITFIDLGGGLLPYLSEGYYPWGTPQGKIARIAHDDAGKKVSFKDRYYISEAVPIATYAEGIGAAIERYLAPLVTCAYYFEPGRVICNNAMHIVVRVMDVKGPRKAITNGGIYMVGWERFEYDYFPLVDLTNPSLKERKVTLYGSLCMQQDLWGYYCYASKIEEGDIILIPYQGALTYSLAQNFIHPIPKVRLLK